VYFAGALAAFSDVRRALDAALAV